MNITVFTPAGGLYPLLGVLLFCAGTVLGVHGLTKRGGNAKNRAVARCPPFDLCRGISLIALSTALDRLLGANATYTLAPFSMAAYCFFLACTLSGWLNKAWDDDRTQTSVALIYSLQILASALSVIAVGAFLLTLFWKIVS